MVDISRTVVNGAYKPTYNILGAPRCKIVIDIQDFSSNGKSSLRSQVSDNYVCSSFYLWVPGSPVIFTGMQPTIRQDLALSMGNTTISRCWNTWNPWIEWECNFSPKRCWKSENLKLFDLFIIITTLWHMYIGSCMFMIGFLDPSRIGMQIYNTIFSS